MVKMKCKALVVMLAFYLCSSRADAQTYSTLKGQVSFSSEAAEENIYASNYNVAAQLVYNNSKGQFIIPIKSFKFKKTVMQEHFNENYLESDLYTKATYKYTIVSMEHVDFSKPGKYAVNTRGVMTIKKTSRNIEVPGYIVVIDNNTIRLEADFLLRPPDYEIQIPGLVERKIAHSIDINIYTTLTKQ